VADSVGMMSGLSYDEAYRNPSRGPCIWFLIPLDTDYLYLTFREGVFRVHLVIRLRRVACALFNRLMYSILSGLPPWLCILICLYRVGVCAFFSPSHQGCIDRNTRIWVECDVTGLL
jgi:hypothetical protein